jgi:hypothetical protein
VFESGGDSAVSLSPLACTAVLKLLKGAANDAGLRGAIFKAFGRIANGIAVAIDEDVGRAIWKQARNSVASDKSLLVQSNACWCLEQLIKSTPYFDNSNDFEKLQIALWKAMESSSVPVRHAAASCLTQELVKSFSDATEKHVVPKLRKPRKTRKPLQGEDLEEIDRASSPAPEKPSTALSYSLLEILRILSNQYCRPATNNKARAGIAICYIKLFKSLGSAVVEQNYGDIARHLFSDILSYPGWQANRYRQLISRNFVQIILERVVGKMLRETAQLNACRYLLNEIIRDYPQAVKERPEPSKTMLTGALSALTSLISDLDAAIGVLAEQCREGLIQVLPHPNFSVQIHAARALKTFVLACPQQLLPAVTICMNSVSRELGFLGGQRQSPRRCVGYAHGLSAVLSTSNQHPLYGSVDVYARVLQQASTLLKSSSSSDLRISSCQLQVAWIMIGGLMSLGPNFVKIHLAQLMLLWRNALPKPVSRDNISQHSMLELSYLAHVRECALGSIRAFLAHNQRLLTSDISRRLSAMLENTVSFLQSLPSRKTSDDPSNRLSPGLQMQDYEIMVRRRVFQCFSQLLQLSPAGSVEPTAHSTILPLAAKSFSDIEYDAPTSLGAAIASAASAFESIWELGDNYGYGLTGLMKGLVVRSPISGKLLPHWSNRSDEESAIDVVIMTPIGTAAEHDPTDCYISSVQDHDLPGPPATEAVDAAISAFARSIPLQSSKVQESTLEQIMSSLSSNYLNKDPFRKAAISINVAVALSTALEIASADTGASKGELRGTGVEKSLQAALHVCLKDNDDGVRSVTALTLGRLCASAGSAFTATEVAYLTETIVNNREPQVRAGCALALAHIHRQLGGMSAGLHMKNIVGILMSLVADPHPRVHFWALDSLAQIADSAGLNFATYVTSTIGMLSQVYVSDNHNPETAALASSNMLMDLAVTAAIARGVNAIINVLGPDLQDMAKSRDMILTLVHLFAEESDVATLLESLKCLDHLMLFAPRHMDLEHYVHRLQTDINSASPEIAEMAVDGFFTLMRRDAPEIIRIAETGLEDRLWEILDRDPRHKTVQSIFTNWLQQTGTSDPADWIQRCNTILTRTLTRSGQPAAASSTRTAGPDLQDEEVAGFAVTAGAGKEDDSQDSTSGQELMRWQVRLFAMNCLSNLIAMIRKEAAISDESEGESALQRKVADVVRIAFSASTAGVAELRVVGMQIIDQVLKLFGKTPDPDFSEAMLLEQYQAQISSALTPAFAADSSPELAAAAVNVCATFISTGIVTDVERMGRILKLLVSALESFSKEGETASIGDLKALSSNAQVMVRMAVFAAWAELQIASAEQSYLRDVVKPQVVQLVPLWLSSLREYARLRFEPDISATNGTPPDSTDLDSVYAALNRETLLKFYQASWLSLVDAIASLIDEDSDCVFNALDGRSTESGDDEQSSQTLARKTASINYREEPVAFFFVLFGLAFESLALRGSQSDTLARQRGMEILTALKKILRPSVAGNAIYQDAIFAETMDLLDRMVLTESLGIQAIIVDIARNLCIVHPSARQRSDSADGSESLSDDIEQLFELTRIIVLVIAGIIPGLSETPVSVQVEASEEASGIVRASLQALVDVSEVFPSIIKADLHASILHIFISILATGSCQSVVVPQALPIFRRFLLSMVSDELPDTRNHIHNALSRMLTILRHAQRRETPASLPCEKNTLLACAVLVSAVQPLLGTDNALVTKLLLELRDCLSTASTTKVAAGCLRTLLLQGIAARHAFSTAIDFLQEELDVEAFSESKNMVGQTLTLYTSKLAHEEKAAAVALLIPLFLKRASRESSTAYTEIAARLLELAAAENTAFRAVVARMASEEKATMEKVLKSQARSRAGQHDGTGDHEPTIQLKMNFGR